MKTFLAASAILLIGFALGWVVKPTQNAPASQPDLTAAPGDSILGATSSGSVQGNSPLGAAESSRTIDELMAIFEDAPSNTGQARAYQFLASFSSKELLSLAQSMESIIPNHHQHWDTIQSIVSRWSEIDPESLFAYGLTVKDLNVKQSCISRAIQALAKRDRGRARALLSAIDDEELKRQASHIVIRATAKDDPKAALAGLQGDHKSRYEYHQLFMTWGAAAPQEAAANLDAITNREARRDAIQGLAQSWGTSEPQAALKWAMSLTNRLERRHAVQRIMGTMDDLNQGAAMLSGLDLKGRDRIEAANAFANKAIQLDLDGALQWMETLTPRERSNVIASQLYSISQRAPERARQLFDENMSSRLRSVADNIARDLAKKDLQSAETWIDSLPSGNIKAQAMKGMINTLQETDPRAAAAYIDGVGIDANTRRMAGSVAQAWFDQDQQAALTWIEAMDNPELTGNLLSHWSQQDPAAAAAYAKNLEETPHQRSALRSIMGNWANINPDEAIAHYKTLKESDQPEVLQTMIGTIANTDIDIAIDFFESSAAHMANVATESQIAQAADNLVDTWADFDAKAAAEWSEALEMPEAREQAIDEAASAWIRQDSLAASEWIGSLPEGPDRDAAVRQLVSHVQHDDPVAAFAWATTLSEEGRRTKYLQIVLNQWKQSDPNAALQALQSASLSNEAYNKLVKQLEQ